MVENITLERHLIELVTAGLLRAAILNAGAGQLDGLGVFMIVKIREDNDHIIRRVDQREGNRHLQRLALLDLLLIIFGDLVVVFIVHRGAQRLTGLGRLKHERPGKGLLVLASVGVVIGQDHRVIALIVLGKRVPLEYGGVLAQGDGLRLVAAVIGAALVLISAAGGQGERHHQRQYRRERPFYFNFHLHFLLFHGTSAFTALIPVLVLPGYCGILPPQCPEAASAAHGHRYHCSCW